STNRRCRAGATVENLAHSASFHCWPNNAPSNPGTKHSGTCQCTCSKRVQASVFSKPNQRGRGGGPRFPHTAPLRRPIPHHPRLMGATERAAVRSEEATTTSR